MCRIRPILFFFFEKIFSKFDYDNTNGKYTERKRRSLLQGILDRFGLSYSVDDDEYIFTEEDIKGFIKTRQDFLDGKTTARDWTEIQEDLNRAYN